MNAFCSFIKPNYNIDFFQVMDTFQKNLINNNFELIATELFNDDPKLQIENLKVRFQTQRFMLYLPSVRTFLDIVKLFSTQKFAKVSTSLDDIVGHRGFDIDIK